MDLFEIKKGTLMCLKLTEGWFLYQKLGRSLVSSPIFIGNLDKVVKRKDGSAYSVFEWFSLKEESSLIQIPSMVDVFKLSVMKSFPSSPHIVDDKNHKGGSYVSINIDQYDEKASLNPPPPLIKKRFADIKKGECFYEGVMGYTHPMIKVGDWAYLQNGLVSDIRMYGVGIDMAADEIAIQAVRNVTEEFILMAYDIVEKGAV